jgi:hypothetical protein
MFVTESGSNLAANESLCIIAVVKSKSLNRMKSGSLLKKAMALKELLCNNDHLFTAQ